MKKFEHKVMEFTPAEHDIRSFTEGLGKDGWELVSVTKSNFIGEMHLLFFLKREMPDPNLVMVDRKYFDSIVDRAWKYFELKK